MEKINYQYILIGLVVFLAILFGVQQLQISSQSNKIAKLEKSVTPSEFTIDYKLEDGTVGSKKIETVTVLKEIINYINREIYAKQQASQAGNANPSNTQPRPTSTEPAI